MRKKKKMKAKRRPEGKITPCRGHCDRPKGVETRVREGERDSERKAWGEEKEKEYLVRPKASRCCKDSWKTQFVLVQENVFRICFSIPVDKNCKIIFAPT